MVTNARHIALLKKAQNSLDSVLEGISSGMPVDLVQIDMTEAWNLWAKLPVKATKTSCWINYSVNSVWESRLKNAIRKQVSSR